MQNLCSFWPTLYISVAFTCSDCEYKKKLLVLRFVHSAHIELTWNKSTQLHNAFIGRARVSATTGLTSAKLNRLVLSKF